MRAHRNCIENLPIFVARVVALMATCLQSRSIDALSVTLLVARIGQTPVLIAAPPTTASAALRFALFFVQIDCMMSMFNGAGGEKRIGLDERARIRRSSTTRTPPRTGVLRAEYRRR